MLSEIQHMQEKPFQKAFIITNVCYDFSFTLQNDIHIYTDRFHHT